MRLKEKLMPMRTINGMAMNYQEKGSGEAVVLLHGFPLDLRVWDDQREALSDRYRVITPDLRGFGGSRSSEAFTMESLADDMHALLEALGALPCVLGGLSMGGYVALAYAKKYPSDLRGLMLIDTRAEGDTPEGRQGREKMIELAKTSGAKAVADSMMPKMRSEQTAQTRPAVVHRLREIMEACPALTTQHAMAAMRDRADQTANLASIAVPTLIIVGEHDAITPVNMAENMKRIPRSALQVIAGAGHMTSMEAPGRVSEVMRGFLVQLQ
jgi:pimeloyl-ACP methyl ester carboxylesterase